MFKFKYLVYALLFFSTAVMGYHAWDDHHWASMSKPFTLQIIDSMTDDWDYPFNESLVLWSQSSIFDLAITSADDKTKTRENCKMKKGQLRICNFDYGETGWWGQSWIDWDSNGHIYQSRIRINEFYADQFTFDNKNWLLCHEVGHSMGLWHAEETDIPHTCMDLSERAESSTPNDHDFEELELIYNHNDSYDSYTPGGMGSGMGSGMGNSQSSGMGMGNGKRKFRTETAELPGGGMRTIHTLLAPAL